MGGCGGLDARVDAQLGQDVAHVNAGRLAADEQRLGYLLVRSPFGDEAKDLELARGEPGDSLPLRDARGVEASASRQPLDVLL
jgi:hypothetical protein